MGLAKHLKSCEQKGHANTKNYLVSYHPMTGLVESDDYCFDCNGHFRRSFNPEEIAEHRRIQSIPLTEYRT